MIGIRCSMIRIPRIRTAPVSLGQWHHVINVEITRICKRLAGEGIKPTARFDTASTVIHFYRFNALGNQHLLPRVLTIAVNVGPLPVEVAVILGRLASLSGPGQRYAESSVSEWLVRLSEPVRE
jgi:hypothetical protein